MCMLYLVFLFVCVYDCGCVAVCVYDYRVCRVIVCVSMFIVCVLLLFVCFYACMVCYGVRVMYV